MDITDSSAHNLEIERKLNNTLCCQKNPTQLQKPEIAFIFGNVVWGLVHSVVLILGQGTWNSLLILFFILFFNY